MAPDDDWFFSGEGRRAREANLRGLARAAEADAAADRLAWPDGSLLADRYPEHPDAARPPYDRKAGQ